MAQPFQSTQKTPVTCPVCNAGPLAKYRGAATYDADTKRQEWAYYPGYQKDGLWWPDCTQGRHPCERPKGAAFGRGPASGEPTGPTDALGQALYNSLKPYLDAQATDTAALEDLIRDSVEALRAEFEAFASKSGPRALDITVKRPAPLPDVKIGLSHNQLPWVQFLMSHRDASGFPLSVNLSGKPGGAKSHTAKQLTDVFGLERFRALAVCKQDGLPKVFGFRDMATGKYHGTAFREVWEHGGLCLFDEWDNGSPTVQVSMNMALSMDRCEFPDGIIARHPDAYFVAATNTAGRGGDPMHPDRPAMDSATIDRFVFVAWQYDHELEHALAARVNPAAAAWVSWIHSVRAHVDASHDKLVVSPRAAITGAALLVDLPDSVTLDALADAVLFKGIDRGIRQRIMAACPFPARVRAQA